MRASIGVAACMMIGAAIWLATLAGPVPAYAQVQQALDEARTIHILSYRWDDGKQIQQGEVWYQRGVGFAAVGRLDGRKVTMVDDGQRTLELVEGQYPTSRPSRIDIHAALASQLSLDAFQRKVERDRSGDRDCGGVMCRMFTQVEDGRCRYRFWVDESNWVRRLEEDVMGRDGQWVRQQAADVQYDLAIDPGHFKLDAGAPPAREPERTRSQVFSLDHALIHTERMGLIFAVHDVKRVEGNLIFVLCSIRPNAGTQQQFGRNPWGMCQQLCDFQLDMIWDPRDGQSRDYIPRQMATMAPGPFDADGVYAAWVILVPRGNWPEPLKACDLKARVYARGPLAQNLQKNGKQHWGAELDQSVRVQVPQQQLPLAELVEAVYGQAQALTTLSSRVQLWQAYERSPEGGRISRAMTVTQTTPEQFLEQVRRMVRETAQPSPTSIPLP